MADLKTKMQHAQANMAIAGNDYWRTNSLKRYFFLDCFNEIDESFSLQIVLLFNTVYNYNQLQIYYAGISSDCIM